MSPEEKRAFEKKLVRRIDLTVLPSEFRVPPRIMKLYADFCRSPCTLTRLNRHRKVTVNRD